MQATHIFDGLEDWPSHIMYLAGGRLKVFEPASSFPMLKEGRLLELVEGYAILGYKPPQYLTVALSMSIIATNT